jgi:hypothetical protein
MPKRSNGSHGTLFSPKQNAKYFKNKHVNRVRIVLPPMPGRPASVQTRRHRSALDHAWIVTDASCAPRRRRCTDAKKRARIRSFRTEALVETIGGDVPLWRHPVLGCWDRNRRLSRTAGSDPERTLTSRIVSPLRASYLSGRIQLSPVHVMLNRSTARQRPTRHIAK